MNNDPAVKKLMEIKRQAEQEEKEINMLDGEINHLLRNLADNFKCKTTEEGEKALIKLEKQCYSLRNKMNDSIDVIIQKMEEHKI